jgi:ligand-binding SRPBCC domain-containing protein
METFERETHVDGSFAAVWDFHSRISGLTGLTPDWMNMSVESIRGPDGEPAPDLLEPDPGVLTAGCEIDVTVRPLGVGPAQHWTSRIVAREEGEGAAFFRDTMVAGPFDHWVHSHYFYAEDGGTKVRDHVEYRLPGGEVGRLAGPFAVIGFEPMFRYRHRETKRLFGRR